ncbi:MAG: biotin/lipoyl-containing protein [Spirochaetia bacterium]|jgi:glutaconyl-CoA decarboxylase|nr:biotin/lipoyl-containing protein [Spirochaetia bacterium]
MKKNLKFELAGKKYSVDVERQGDSLVIENEGKTVTVNLLEGEKKAARPKPRPAAASPVAAAPAPAPAAASASGSAGDIKAPMTGTIKEIKVSKGDKVEADQLVVIMEAMKMDIEVFAHISGTVADIYLAPGSSVKENQPVVKLA